MTDTLGAAVSRGIGASLRDDNQRHLPHWLRTVGDGLEKIDVIRYVLGPVRFAAYCQGQVIKYATRAGTKDGAPFKDDMHKASNYALGAAGIDWRTNLPWVWPEVTP